MEEHEIQERVVSAFKNLLIESWHPSVRLEFERTGGEDAAKLEEAFTLSELSRDKAPRLNGFSLVCWQFR